MLRKIIRGEFHVSNSKIEPKTEEYYWKLHRIYHALATNKHLRAVINYDREWYGADSVWSQKGFKPLDSGMKFNSPSPAWNDRQGFLNFVNALKELMETEEAVTLGLSGSLEITMETAKFPLIFRVEVKDGKVSYQEAEYVVWGEEVVA
jgi:hypothetical protein